MESSELPTKSSNEILTELFGAFNAEPPKIVLTTKCTSSSEEKKSKHCKKSKKSKCKKHKKKHRSKSKKRKRKGSDSESDSDSVKKKSKNESSPHGVNIELPINKVPMALEILLDGTVGIKGEDGVITKIPDTYDSSQIESELETNLNGYKSDAVCDEGVKEEFELGIEANVQVEKQGISKSKTPELFETRLLEAGDKQKKGKIQIKDLKFSSVFQETVRAAEEQKKQESYEEGELSDSSNDDQNLDSEKLSIKDHRKHRHCRSSRSHHRKDNSDHKRKRSEKSRSRSSHKNCLRHHSRSCKGRKHRSKSRDHYSRNCHSRHSTTSLGSQHFRSRSESRSRSRSRSRSGDRKKSRTSPNSSPKDSKYYSQQTKSKEETKPIEKIDKEKLLAIARKNALKLIDAGIVPGTDKLTTIKAGGKTVNELTEYCKRLSEKEALGDDISDIESESSPDEEKPFHHPFQVRDRPSSIIMNIKNSIPLPVKSLQEKAAEQAKQLRLQFPVSSGSSHRRNESEWVPVSPKKDEPPPKQRVVSVPQNIPQPAPVPTHIFEAPPPLPPPPPPHQMALYMSVPPPNLNNKPVFPVIQPTPPMPKLDISSIVSKRLEAIRKLQENPNDSHALTQMYNAQQEMQFWAESKQETGAFTGSTGAKVLSPSELSSGAQAWAKRDQLTNATPVRGGMGMTLLQKMGWQPGEGLGKNKEGTLEPLRLEVKMDKKGLLAAGESQKWRKGMQPGPPMPTVKTLEGKHPVSLLNELCSRRRYGVPQYELCFECGPDHKKNFLFKVIVNGAEYTPTVASPNKKQAKAEAASICLRALGIISS